MSETKLPYEHILITGPGHTEESIAHIKQAWESLEVRYCIIGDGERPLIKEELDAVLQSGCNHQTRIHYWGHGRIHRAGEQRTHVLRIYKEIIALEVLLAQHRHIPGIRHIWSCHAGAGTERLKDVVSADTPVILHSSGKYSLLTVLTDPITASLPTVTKIAGRVSDSALEGAVYDLDETLCLSPDTATLVAKVGGDVRSYKVTAPKGYWQRDDLQAHIDASRRGLYQFFGQNFTPRQLDAIEKEAYYFLALMLGAGRNYAVLPEQETKPACVNWVFYGYTPLATAIIKNHTKAVKQLLMMGADPNAVQMNDKTPLLWACKMGRVELVQLLLDAGADVNADFAKGITPLVAACSETKPEVVSVLLNHKDIKLPKLRQLLILAKGHEGIKEQLLCKAEELKVNAAELLGYACEFGSPERVERLLGGSAEQRCSMLMTMCFTQQSAGLAPLIHSLDNHLKWEDISVFMAVGRYHPKVVNVLLEHVQSTGKAMALLQDACAKGNERVVNCIVDKGNIDLNAPLMCHAPLYLAAKNGHAVTVTLLLEHGARVDMEVPIGNNPLYRACKNAHSEAVEVLLKHVHLKPAHFIRLIAASGQCQANVELLLGKAQEQGIGVDDLYARACRKDKPKAAETLRGYIQGAVVVDRVKQPFAERVSQQPDVRSISH